MQVPTLIGLRQYNHALTSSLHTLLSLASCVASCEPTSLIANALFIPSNQPNLGLPFSCQPSTLAALNFLGQRPSSIHSTCPNYCNTLVSTYSGERVLYTRLHSDLFVPNPIPSHNPRHRSQALHFKHIQATSFCFFQPPSFSAVRDVETITCCYKVFLTSQLIVLPFRTLLTTPSTLLLGII